MAFVQTYQNKLILFFITINIAFILLTFIILQNVSVQQVPIALLGILICMLTINGISYWLMYSGTILRYIEANSSSL